MAHFACFCAWAMAASSATNVAGACWPRPIGAVGAAAELPKLVGAGTTGRGTTAGGGMAFGVGTAGGGENAGGGATAAVVDGLGAKVGGPDGADGADGGAKDEEAGGGVGVHV